MGRRRYAEVSEGERQTVAFLEWFGTYGLPIELDEEIQANSTYQEIRLEKIRAKHGDEIADLTMAEWGSDDDDSELFAEVSPDDFSG